MVKKDKNKSLSYKGFCEDKFLNKIFKKNCYIATKEKYVKLFKYFKNSFIFLKTKKKISTKNNIEKKLKFLGSNITYQKKIKSTEEYFKEKNISYKINLKNYEKKIVINIAYKNFNFSRFHLDKRLSKNKSNLIKKKTLENYFLGFRSDKIFVQLYKKKISGFCLFKFKNKDIAIIDLICIDKRFSRKGLASDMIRYSLQRLKKMNRKKIIVSTQEKNLAAIKLYNSFKFIPKNKFFLYHYIS